MTAVKDELPHGQFLPWIAAEFEMTKDTAQNFMSVFDRFGKNGNFPYLNFKPSILYALSAPSTPEHRHSLVALLFGHGVASRIDSKAK